MPLIANAPRGVTRDLDDGVLRGTRAIGRGAFIVDDNGRGEWGSGNGDDEDGLNKNGSRTRLGLGHGSLIGRRQLLCGQNYRGGSQQSQDLDDVALHIDLGNNAARVSLIGSIGR
jgi:hypothetical protein